MLCFIVKKKSMRKEMVFPRISENVLGYGELLEGIKTI